MNRKSPHSIQRKLNTFFASTVLLVAIHSADAQSAYYNFEGSTLSPAYNTLIDITASDMSLVNAGDTGYSSSSNSGGAYPGASGGINYYSTTPKPTGADDPYYAFTLTPATGRSVQLDSLSFGIRTLTEPAVTAPAPGPKRYEIFTSVDSYTTPVASGDFNLAAGSYNYWYMYEHSGLAVAAPVDTPIELRIVLLECVEGISRGGSLRIDDVHIGATSLPTEPEAIYTFINAADEGTLAPSNTTLQDIGSGNITLVNAAEVDFLTTQSSAGAYPGASGSYNYASNTPKPTGAPDPYFSFTLSPLDGKTVQLDSLSFGVRTLTEPAVPAPAPGPQSYEIFTSADGFTSAVTSGALTLVAGSSNYWYRYVNAGLAVQATAGSPLEVRVYFRGALEGVSRPGSFRIDDVRVSATATGGVTRVTSIGLESGVLKISFSSPASSFNLLGNTDLSTPISGWSSLSTGVDLFDLGGGTWRYDVDIAATGQKFFVIEEVVAP